jgi:hypothetical protein
MAFHAILEELRVFESASQYRARTTAGLGERGRTDDEGSSALLPPPDLPRSPVD